MADTGDKGLQIATDYFRAWAGGDVEKALTFLSDDIEGTAPNGTFEGHEGYRGFIGGFLHMLTGTENFVAFADDSAALLWYDTNLKPVPALTVAERLTIDGDKITRIDMVFDQTPLTEAFNKK